MTNTPMIRQIQDVVCEEYEVTRVDMLSDRRSQDIARPRMLAMYICAEYTTYSLPQIGRDFGGRDHTTVIHARKTIRRHLDNDVILNKRLERILSRIEDIDDIDAWIEHQEKIKRAKEAASITADAFRVAIMEMAEHEPQVVLDRLYKSFMSGA